MIKCCKGCVPPKRHTACWGTCPEYIAEKAEYTKKKAEYDRQRDISCSIYMSRTEKVEKAMKNRRTKL